MISYGFADEEGSITVISKKEYTLATQDCIVWKIVHECHINKKTGLNKLFAVLNMLLYRTTEESNLKYIFMYKI